MLYNIKQSCLLWMAFLSESTTMPCYVAYITRGYIIVVWSIFAALISATIGWILVVQCVLSMKNLLYLLLAASIIFTASCQQSSKEKSVLVAKDGVYAHPAVLPLTQQLSENPQDASLYYKRGQALRTIGEDSVALLDFYRATELDSSKSKYFSSIGELLFEHKDVEGLSEVV